MAPKGRPSRILELEPIKQDEEEDIFSTSATEQSTDTKQYSVEEEKAIREALLVHLTQETPLVELIIQLCQQRDKLTYAKTANTTEMGYVAHLTRLAQLLMQISDKDDDLGEYLATANSGAWNTFLETTMQARIS